MHLIFQGFTSEICDSANINDKFSPLNSMWWAGYTMGLLMAGLLTQEEHDAAVNLITSLKKE